MLAHVRLAHTNENTKFCCPLEDCGKVFNYKHVLERHVNGKLCNKVRIN